MAYAARMAAPAAAVPTFVSVAATTRPAASLTVSQAEARRQLSLHQNALSKLLNSGYLTLQEVCVEKAARADFLTIASGQVVVIQTDVAAESAEVPSWRPYVGDGPELTDAEWLDANRGDWHGFDPHQALTAGYALVTLGSYVTGVIRLHGLELSRHDRYQIKHRFHAEVVARLTTTSSGQPPLADAQRSRREVACGPNERPLAQILGQRIAPKAGPQAYLWRSAPPPARAPRRTPSAGKDVS